MKWGIYERILGVWALIEIVDDYREALEYKRMGFLIEEFHDED